MFGINVKIAREVAGLNGVGCRTHTAESCNRMVRVLPSGEAGPGDFWLGPTFGGTYTVSVFLKNIESVCVAIWRYMYSRFCKKRGTIHVWIGGGMGCF